MLFLNKIAFLSVQRDVNKQIQNIELSFKTD